jgi:hypothetical protein
MTCPRPFRVIRTNNRGWRTPDEGASSVPGPIPDIARTARSRQIDSGSFSRKVAEAGISGLVLDLPFANRQECASSATYEYR